MECQYIVVDKDFKIVDTNLKEIDITTDNFNSMYPSMQSYFKKELALSVPEAYQKKIILEKYINGKYYFIFSHLVEGAELCIRLNVLDITSYKIGKIQEEKKKELDQKKSKYLNTNELVSSFVHETNTPLSSALINVDAIRSIIKKREDNSFEKILNYANKAINAIHACKSNIKNLKNIYFDVNDFGLNNVFEIMHKAIDIMSFKTMNKGIKVNLDCSDNIWIECNHMQIVEVIVNLFNNSYNSLMDIQDNRNINIRVIEQGSFVKIFWGDTGPKIPDKMASKLFDDFLSSQYVGIVPEHGLGMNIVKNIINLHTGSIECNQSEPNTKFIIQLPIISQIKEAEYG